MPVIRIIITFIICFPIAPLISLIVRATFPKRT